MNTQSVRYLQNQKLIEQRKLRSCTSCKFQSYNPVDFGQVVTIKGPSYYALARQSAMNNLKSQQYIINQQNLYANMRRHPEQYPIIPWVQQMGLSPGDQRRYSNLWYRQFGTSQALPANDNFGGFYIVGSEVPYTN